MRLLKADAVSFREAAITAQNQFTPWVRVDGRSGKPNTFCASIADDAATLNVTFVVEARRVKGDGTAGNQCLLESVSVAAGSLGTLKSYSLVGTWEVRCGVRTGGYTAGSGVAAIHY